MAHKGQSEPPVSLFSFQDIVTSLTGIMFLIVILLALILFANHPESRRMQAADPEIRALAEQLAQRRKELQTLQKHAAELAAADPEELARRYETLQQTIQYQRQEEPELERQIAALTQEWKRLEAERRQTRQALTDAEAEARRLAAEKAQAEAALKAAETQKEEYRKLLRFQVDAPTGKSVVIGICGKDAIEFRDVAAGRTLAVPLTNSADSPELHTALARFRPEIQYFCLFFRPDSYDYADSLLELLKKSGFERGLEPLPGNDNQLDFTAFPASAGGRL